MSGLLHLDSSANRSHDSVSRELSSLFAKAWRDVHGSAGYRHRDLADEPIAPIGTAYCTLGRRVERHGLVSLSKVADLIETPDEAREWSLTRPLISEVLETDIVLIGAPMYNYTVPASLKAWIDRVSFPGAFLDPGTRTSRLRDTRVVVVSARGGAYGPGTPREGWDFQTPYLRAYFGKQGVVDENICFVHAEMTLAGLVPHLARFGPFAARSLAEARSRLIELATDGTHA